jgi:hypothetical protein
MKPGMKLVSSASTAQVIVVRLPKSAVTITCGGAPMTEPGDAQEPSSGDGTGALDGVALGKRYGDAASGLEVLCIRPGSGPLAADGRELSLKEAKPLPSSD